MPEIKYKHVVTCSSEDKNYPAENLLKSEGTCKWKSATKGEKQVTVTLQFEKAEKIHQIDIGNEGSAFIEVLVNKSGSTEDFQVILVASSFMNPQESRSGTMLNRVRMFTSDQLSNAVSGQKWDVVKIVCTQPFNKNIAYGLSFVKFRTPPAPGEETSPVATTLGKFKVKAEENDVIKTGSLFANRGKEKTESPVLTGAAAARAASRLVDESSPSSSVTPRPNSSSSTPVAARRPVTPVEKRATPEAVKRKKPENHEADDVPIAKPAMKKQSTSISSVSSAGSAKKEGPPPLKKTKSEPGKPSKEKEFHKLMENVVFVLSGFQNPQRGQIRDRAMDMGAKYRPDWGKGCTHLICAFANTPKYNQVKGRGKIVKKEWINDCYKQKRMFPWRKYRLGDAESPSESSEEDEPYVPKKKTPSIKEAKPSPQKASTSKTVTNDDEDYSASTDVDESGGDTDDEIRRFQESQEKQKKKQQTPKKSPVKQSKVDDPYGASTDEEMEDDADSGVPDLPDFFANKVFFLYGKFAAADRRLLMRYITAYDGTVEEYMNEKVHYVITDSKWDDNFDDALSDNPGLAFLKPAWIYACEEKQKMVPHQKYIVVPE